MSLSRHGRLNDLIRNLDEFQHKVYMDPSVYRQHVHRPQLEELLERIVSGAAVIADLDNTRPERHDQIIAGLNNLRQALQDLLTEYEKNVGWGQRRRVKRVSPSFCPIPVFPNGI